MQAINSLKFSAKEISNNRRAATASFVVFIALLLSLALFVTTTLATMRAVLLTFLSMLLVPVFFFLLQTMCVSFTRVDVKATDWLKYCLQNFWKLFLASVPIIVTAWLVYLMFGKIEAQQTNVLTSTIKLLLFGFVFPLTVIHLWIETVKTETVLTFKNFKSVLSKAFAPVSVLIYLCGLFIFAFVPYLLLSPRIPIQQNFVVISLLILRIVIAVLFIFFGWAITVNALRRNTQKA